MDIKDLEKIISDMPQRFILIANNSRKSSIPEEYRHLISFDDFAPHDRIIKYYPNRKLKPKPKFSILSEYGVCINKPYAAINFSGIQEG